MSWDIFALDIPPEIKSVEEIPSDSPKPLGTRSAVISKIKELIPNRRFF